VPKSYAHADSSLNVMRATNYTAFTAWVTLYTVNPTESGGGTEVAGGGYARASVAFGAPGGTPRQIANTAELLITMPAATVTGVGVMSASTGGVLKYFTAIPDKVYRAGEQARLAIGALIVQEA
jgi:hypothetical protein